MERGDAIVAPIKPPRIDKPTRCGGLGCSCTVINLKISDISLIHLRGRRSASWTFFLINSLRMSFRSISLLELCLSINRLDQSLKFLTLIVST
jgi:hypothetical protein